MSLPRPPRPRCADTIVLAGAAACLLAALPAAAHEYWLAPSLYRARAGERVAVSAFVGTGFRGEPKPWAAPRAVRFELAGPRRLDLRPATVNGALEWAGFVMPDAEGAMVAYQSGFTSIQLAATEFDAYLELEGLDEPRAARARLGGRAGPGRERYARCPKAWIAGEPAGARRPSAARASVPLGLPLEIVPLADPASQTPLPVRVLWRGRPLAGALVRAWNRPLVDGWAPVDGAARDSVGPAAAARTDARGVVRLHLGRSGEWMIATVHMVRCPEPAEADWESWWASLTLARGAAR